MKKKSLLTFLVAACLSLCLLGGFSANRTVNAKADDASAKTDITSTVTINNWGYGNNYSDCTRIMLMIGKGNFDSAKQSKHINDNPGTFSVDLCEYIYISVDGGEERSVRSILTDNGDGVTKYKGANFPMSIGGVYSPIDVISRDNHVEIEVLAEFAPVGHFYIRLKSGFRIETATAECVTTDDVLFGYAENGNWTRMYEATFNVEGKLTKIVMATGLTPSADGIDTAKASTVSTDYEFIGWDKEIGKLTQNTTYTAQYRESARKYDVKFGADATPVKAEYGSKLEKPQDPTKDPTVDKVYTFAGWYNGETEWNFEDDTILGDLTLTPKFNESVREYDVVIGDAAAVKKAYGSKLEKPQNDPTSTKLGYTVTFDGWYNGDTKWNFETDTVTGDVTLVAKFNETVNTYSATLNLADGSNHTITYTIENRTEKLAEAKALLSADNAQYAYTDDLPTELPLENGKTYTESRTVKEYDIIIGDAAAVKKPYGSKLEKPQDPTKANTAEKVYAFDGWYNGETKWDFETDTVTGDVTLVPEFIESARTYTVTINFTGLDKEHVQLTLEYGKKVDFTAYNENGYTFVIKNGEEKITEFTVTGDATLTVEYAKVQAAKKGCKGSIGGSAAVLAMLGFAALALKKKNK